MVSTSLISSLCYNFTCANPFKFEFYSKDLYNWRENCLDLKGWKNPF